MRTGIGAEAQANRILHDSWRTSKSPPCAQGPDSVWMHSRHQL